LPEYQRRFCYAEWYSFQTVFGIKIKKEITMIKSMTGFGRAEVITKERKITVELKSVNHRYLDLSIKMPRKLVFLEGAIRNLMKTYMQRGKVDVFITYEDYTLSCGALKYNKELAGEYLAYIRQMAEEFGLENDVKAGALSRYPDVLTMEEQSVDEDALWAVLEAPLREACEKFAQSRAREGENLKNDLIAKLDALDEKVSQVEARSPEVVDSYREKLEAKVHELLEDSQIEDSRIASEVVLFSDKICNDEETVRLHSHIQGMKKMLEEKEGIGRKLDFMAQEMNREANTILSKSSDLIISNIAIDLKTEIEKIREQVQNVE
jgi:TIGR00255 family protein